MRNGESTKPQLEIFLKECRQLPPRTAARVGGIASHAHAARRLFDTDISDASSRALALSSPPRAIAADAD